MQATESNLSRLNLDYETVKTTIESNISDEAGSEYLFVLPVIVIFGLCGNIISMVTILNSRLRTVNL
jgi:hypothetical protein